MYIIKVALVILSLGLLAGCQSESFNPVDSTSSDLTLNKAGFVYSSRLFAFDGKEPKAWGQLDYQQTGGIEFSFRGHKLLRNTNYVLCYGNIEVATGKTNNGGNLILSGKAENIYYETAFSLWYADENGKLLSPVPTEAKVLSEGAKSNGVNK
ncbi:MAG: hypothetical protein R6W68_10280 [Ignavibacteriaceae bacterium]